MNDLPHGWAEVKLSELASHRSGNSKLIKGKLSSEPTASFPYKGYSASGQDVWLDTYQYDGDAIIISAVGARCGKAFSASGRWSAVANTHIVWTYPQIINHRLFWYLINDESFWVRGGSAQPFVKVPKTFERMFKLPPLKEQKRIADKLDAVLARVDACLDRIDRIPAILKRFRQSVLAAATSGKLTEDWRISNSEATGQYVSSEIYNKLPDLPSSWCYERLGKLLLGLKYGTSQKCEYEKKGKPVFRIPNIGDGVLINDNMKYAELPEKEYQQLALQAGDILMIRSNGSVSLVGKTALVSSDFVGYAYAGYLIRLRPNEEVQPGYLNHVLASMWLRQQIEIPARSTSGINNINSEEVRNLLIPLPPVDEQTEIVRRVEALFAFADRLEARHQAARAQVEKLNPATLAKAFRGELVPQDPDDEPASVLLERIQAARAAVVGTGSPKRRKVSEKAVRKFNAEVIMLELSRIKSDHLKSILKEQGKLAPKVLWRASQLSIEDFYEQLRTEEAKRLLREVREGNDSFLEAA